jgi:hypothetical protein
VDDKVHDLGTVYFGAPVTRAVPIRNLGSGCLTGRVKSDHAELQGKNFQVPDAPAAGELYLTIDPGNKPPAAPQDCVKALWLETNTPVFDWKRLPLTVRYRIELMQLEPRQINFKTTVGLTEKFQVRALTGSNQPIEGEIAPGQRVPEWLHLEMTSPGEILLEIRGDKWAGQAGEIVQKELRLRDRRTGLTGMVVLRGEFLTPKIEVDQTSLNFGKIKKPKTSSLSLKVRNKGRGVLALNRIVLDHEWLSVESKKWENESTAELSVSVDSSKCPPGRNRGVILLNTNDPVSPQVTVLAEAIILRGDTSDQSRPLGLWYGSR